MNPEAIFGKKSENVYGNNLFSWMPSVGLTMPIMPTPWASKTWVKTQRNPGPGSGEAMVPLYLNSYVEDIAKKRPKLDLSPRQLYMKTQLLLMPLPTLWFHLGEGNPTSALLSSLGSSSSSNFNTLLRQFPLASKFGSAPLALFLCCWLTHVSQKFSRGSTLLHS